MSLPMKFCVAIMQVCWLVGLLAACRPAAVSPTTTPIPDDAMAPADIPTYGLAPGGYRLALVGAVQGQAVAAGDGAEFGPALAGMRFPGSNEAGHVGLALTAHLDSGEEAVLLLEFDGAIGSGTHRIGSNSALNPAAVGAEMRVSGRSPFDQRVSGILTLDFINRRSINGEVDITLLNADGQSVTARGAFHLVPFTPHETYSVSLSGVYQTVDFTPHFSKGQQGNRRFIILGFTARRAFAGSVSGDITIEAQDSAALQPGEYDLTAVDAPVRVQVRLGDETIAVERGTVVFLRTHDTINGVQHRVWQGGFTLALPTNVGEATLTGLFNDFDE